jgi:hypothetical protein
MSWIAHKDHHGQLLPYVKRRQKKVSGARAVSNHSGTASDHKVGGAFRQRLYWQGHEGPGNRHAIVSQIARTRMDQVGGDGEEEQHETSSRARHPNQDSQHNSSAVPASRIQLRSPWFLIQPTDSPSIFIGRVKRLSNTRVAEVRSNPVRSPAQDANGREPCGRTNWQTGRRQRTQRFPLRGCWLPSGVV